MEEILVAVVRGDDPALRGDGISVLFGASLLMCRKRQGVCEGQGTERERERERGTERQRERVRERERKGESVTEKN